MILRPLVFAALGATLLLSHPLLAQQPAEPAADPLPAGALVRFGTTRPILRTNPSVGLIPPKYTNFLAPTMNGGIKRYDLGTGRPLQKNGIVGPGHVVVSTDGKRAAVALTGGVNVFDIATGNQVLAIKPPEGVIIAGVPGVALSADGKILAFAGKGLDVRGEVVVIDVDQNEVLAQCTTNQAAPVYVTLSRDGKTLISYGPPAPAPKLTPAPAPKAPPEMEANDPDVARTAQVWEVASGRELFKARVTGMGGNVVTAALSPDAELLAIAAGDGPIDVFDVKSGERRHTLLGRKSQGVKVAFSPDGKLIASIGLDYRIQRWHSDGKPLDITEAPPGMLIAPITGLEFADNQRVIGSMTAAQFAYAWDAPNGKLLSPVMDHAAALRSIAFPAGGKDLFSSGLEGKAFRWNLASGALGEEIAFRPAHIPGQPLIRPVVNLSSDGTRAFWAKAPTAEVFDVGTGDNLHIIPPPSSPPAAVTFSTSPDGMRIASMCRPAVGKRTGHCVIWDLATRQRVAELETPSLSTGSAQLAAFTPDGARVVIIAFAYRPQGAPVLTLVGYDLKTGKKLSSVEDVNASGTISFAAINDTTVVAATHAGRMWTIDYANGQVGDDFDNVISKGETPVTGPIAVSADGKRFAVGISDEPFTTYGIRVYDVAAKKALHTFVGHAGPVSAIHFSPDGNAVASGAQDTSVILWDLSKLGKEP
jgi:WD40 repeat protein